MNEILFLLLLPIFYYFSGFFLWQCYLYTFSFISLLFCHHFSTHFFLTFNIYLENTLQFLCLYNDMPTFKYNFKEDFYSVSLISSFFYPYFSISYNHIQYSPLAIRNRRIITISSLCSYQYVCLGKTFQEVFRIVFFARVTKTSETMLISSQNCIWNI